MQGERRERMGGKEGRRKGEKASYSFFFLSSCSMEMGFGKSLCWELLQPSRLTTIVRL